ncbi:alpha/beta hydrolase [Calycomorphotria hydatis]|uniref:Putative hydrolase n=1 Tax=Calycomorphotria hydatis TaxID=2528027 RepID=A0A517T6A5_9PLAN|nr:phospholipase [Calycomorphotria hydatis]QDT63904.1 putative hydrolase [Calycomorphotria hydatis]
MKSDVRQVGPLLSTVVEGVDAQPSVLVVLCHGFGAPGTDLVPLAEELGRLKPELKNRVRFVFPQAPMGLEEMGMPGGRAWWWIDMQRLALAAAAGATRDLRSELPEGMVEASDQLLACVEAARAEMPNESKLVMGGFSQGSMVATDVTLRLRKEKQISPELLTVFSGSLLAEERWRSMITYEPKLSVTISHGRIDPVLPFAGAEHLRELFTEFGHDVTFFPFSGGHTIPWEPLEELANRLEKLVTQSTP